jgi:uncharacterized protein YutE (UPF0331/DUF86 family)
MTSTRRPSVERLREIASDVAREAGYRLVVLFGSSARGESNPSDLDIGVESASALDTVDAMTQRSARSPCGGTLIRKNFAMPCATISASMPVSIRPVTTIDAAVDINNHLLRSIGQPPAEDYFGSFVQLGRSGLIDPELANSLAPAAGLRNRIVHAYEELNDAMVLEAAKMARSNFSDYIAAVENYLTASGR